jgi:hypothetical protein
VTKWNWDRKQRDKRQAEKKRAKEEREMQGLPPIKRKRGPRKPKE